MNTVTSGFGTDIKNGITYASRFAKEDLILPD